jgi:hypothetical protein
MSQASTSLASYPLDSIAQLLTALQSFNCALPPALLSSAAELATEGVARMSPASLVSLLGVFAALRFHPGVQLLHIAAQHLTEVSVCDVRGCVCVCGWCVCGGGGRVWSTVGSWNEGPARVCFQAYIHNHTIRASQTPLGFKGH